MVRQVTRYEAEDGSVHDTEAAAIDYERRSKFKQRYESDPMQTNIGKNRPSALVEWDAFDSWLQKRPGFAREVLGISKPKSTAMPRDVFLALVEVCGAGYTYNRYPRPMPDLAPVCRDRLCSASPIPGEGSILSRLGYTSIEGE